MTDARPPLAVPDHLLRFSAALSARHPQDPEGIRQPQVDPLKAHAEARAHLDEFTGLLQTFGQHTGTAFQQRPSGVKHLDRYVEKYLDYDLVPLDILAAKFVFPTLRGLYEAAIQLDSVFQVEGFRDRFVRPRQSGYRDLQFVVSLSGHLAEVKLCHQLFDDLDAHEHTLYELRRRLEASDALSEIDTLVLDKLENVSAELFQTVWQRTLQKEVEDDEILSGR
ncbi:hypothetical protein [Deinococcus ruber]|uniref:RelA/SpoT domain-containing protein n=1 Tax=Deinococcus ruber TaxID=1848197 RepID=A0A918CJH1_9DEIO|nr:hypothetical protein [Deinococcus ruber]GGR27274.1 hypothetical protein GCM10008957_43310 [Deinococcus ruber]